jgi:hypothetical protein
MVVSFVMGGTLLKLQISSKRKWLKVRIKSFVKERQVPAISNLNFWAVRIALPFFANALREFAKYRVAVWLTSKKTCLPP